MPELETHEEVQEDFGWENLSANDDGSRDMGERNADPQSAPEPVGEGASAEVAPEPTPKAAEQVPAGQIVEPAAGEPGQLAGEGAVEEAFFTLPGGKKVTKAELIANDKLLENLVTHSNQLTNYQKISDDRKQRIAALEAENRRILDEYTMYQMQQQNALAQNQQHQQPPPERPGSQVLEGAFAPHLDKLVSDGRLTQEQRTEFGNLIAEYLYDQRNVFQTMNTLVEAASQEIYGIKSQLTGQVTPAVDQFVQDRARSFDFAIQQEAASIPGYEALKDANEWNRLKDFINSKVRAHGFREDGRPNFDPDFDATTMAQMYDAMTGAAIRQRMLLGQAQEQQTQKQKQEAALVGGETAARAGGPPKPKQPSPMTPEEEALDFSDPAMTRS